MTTLFIHSQLILKIKNSRLSVDKTTTNKQKQEKESTFFCFLVLIPNVLSLTWKKELEYNCKKSYNIYKNFVAEC